MITKNYLMFEQLIEISLLENGWNGLDNSIPVDQDIVYRVVHYIENLDEDIPKPHICAIHDGTIELQWSIGLNDIFLNFEENGQLECCIYETQTFGLTVTYETIENEKKLHEFIVKLKGE